MPKVGWITSAFDYYLPSDWRAAWMITTTGLTLDTTKRKRYNFANVFAFHSSGPLTMPNLLHTMTPTTSCLCPAISLRMKCTASKSGPAATVDQALSRDQLNVMAKQDIRQCSSLSADFRRLLQQDQDQVIDMEVARKRMIDWKFRVVDHYGIARDAVATSTSILDRLVRSTPQQWQDGEKSAFKLAAMTALYVAAKVQDQTRLLSIDKLVDLSRGEFSAGDIEAMESSMLAQLGWRVNPVTVHSFIHSLMKLVRNKNPLILAATYDRAIFFAELSLFDQRYVTSSRGFLATACVLNALEGIGESQACEQSFLEVLQAQTDLDFTHYPSLDQVREDLWYVYSLSAQYQEDDLNLSVSPSSSSTVSYHHAMADSQSKNVIHHHTHSPTTVR
jgi:Cyclin, N-terminal domain